ncbi:MAG: hypothetical protein O3C34_17370 [Proteobacteria bacterium]|nr:hypothetical protein [Pseudomonadota bacterium]
MDLQKWVNLGIVLVLAFFLAVLEASDDSLYKTLKDWQTFLAGIIGFVTLAFGTYAGHAANRARDDRLREQEARAIAAALSSEFRAHVKIWSSLRTALTIGSSFPLTSTIYNAYASKIGLLGYVPARVVVKAFATESMGERMLKSRMLKSNWDELGQIADGQAQKTALIDGFVAVIEVLADYLGNYAETGSWREEPELEPVRDPGGFHKEE